MNPKSKKLTKRPNANKKRKKKRSADLRRRKQLQLRQLKKVKRPVTRRKASPRSRLSTLRSPMPTTLTLRNSFLT